MFTWHKCKTEKRFYLPCGEYILKLIGTEEMPLFIPVTLSVSTSISWRTSSKSVNFFPLQCRNSAYSVKNINNNCHWLAHPLAPSVLWMCGHRSWSSWLSGNCYSDCTYENQPSTRKAQLKVKLTGYDLLLLSLAHHLLEQCERFN